MENRSKGAWFGLIPILLIMAAVVAGSSGQAATHDHADCSTCHSLRADLTPLSDPRAGFDRQCRKCHSVPLEGSETPSLSFHDDKERNCLDCHSFHDRTTINADGQSFRLDYHNLLLRFQCESCHSQKGQLAKLSEGHRQAAALYHSDLPLLTSLSPSDRCLICHSRQSTPLPIPDIAAASPRFDEHASHPYGVPVQPGQSSSGGRIKTQIDPAVILFDGRIECQSCHCLTSGKADLPIVAESESTPVCFGCHTGG
jgi:hypothetical protein